MTANNDALPPLPEPVAEVFAAAGEGYDFLTPGKCYYTPDQMRDYARAAIRALSADRGEAVAVGELDRSAPPRVWLQVDTDGDNDDRSEPIPRANWGEMSWYYESIGGQEVEYVRADLVPPSPAESADPESERRMRDGIMPPHRLDGIVPAAPSGVSDAMVERAVAAWWSVPIDLRTSSVPQAMRAALEAAQPQPGRVEGFPLFEFTSLLMCSDPWPVDDAGHGTGQDALVALADRESQKAGFRDWIDALHELKGPAK